MPDDTMTEATSVTLELSRADGAPDLWPAIEAAQYARIIDHETPRTDAEASAMADLVGFFSDCSEQWEQQSASEQKTALEQMGNRLTALRELGLFVYSGTTQIRVDTAEGATTALPLVVLIIRREYHQTIDITLPMSAGID